MLHRYLLSAFLIFALFANAQKKTSPENFAKTITAESLKKHLSVIAGAEMEGRNTPSPGLEKAAAYIEAQFAKAGMKPGNNGSYRQTYVLAKDSAVDAVLSINGRPFTLYEDFVPSFMMSEDAEASFSEYVLAGYGIVDANRNDYAGIDVKDKLVVIFDGMPQGFQPAKSGRQSSTTISNKLKAAYQKGAKAIVVVVESLPKRNDVRAAAYRPVPRQQEAGSKTPLIFLMHEKVVEAVSGENIAAVKSALDNGIAPLGVSASAISLKYKSNKSYAHTSNILGLVEGSDKKDEYVIITAHYDHVGKDAKGNIFYGADDDGSGTVSVLAMAEAFAKAKKSGKGPRRSILFMTVSGEEKGLWGSEYYAENPVFPLEKTSANLNIDMIGRVGADYLKDKDAENYIYTIGDDKLSSDLAPVTDMVNSKYTKLKLDRKYNDPTDVNRFYYRSDHYNFARKGVPAIFYFNGVHSDYHQITDTVDKINFPLMARRAQLVFYTAWEIANSSEMLKRDLKLPAL